jgi:dihydropyrimidinase
MPLLIKNGNVVTSVDNFVADVYCESDTISRIGKNLDVPHDTEVIDATGKYLFPGFIDPHVHIYLPFMGTYAKDTYDSGSRAALVGGTTTLIEMCCPSRGEEPLKSFELWRSKAEGISACDFTFHMGISRYDADAEKQLREIVRQGISSFKVFLAYKNFFGVNDDELYQTLKLAKELGVIVTAHCENETMVARLQHELLSAGKTGPEWHEPSRPVTVEASGVEHLLRFAELTDASVYIVHTSCREAVNAAMAGRKRGLKVWVETVAPYLVFDDTYAQRPDFEGAKYVMSPPIRAKHHQPYLWEALERGDIDTVATDHAPFDFKSQKIMGLHNFTLIPNGIPSVEHRIDVLYSYGVKQGKLDLNRMVDVGSTKAAKLFGLFPRKGTIAVGSDADIVIYDPNYRGKISSSTHQMATDYSAFEGWPVEGRADIVTVRGKVQVRDGNFAGALGHGQFLARPCIH